MAPLDPDRCDFIKKNGQQCLRSKGCGTDHASAGRCKTHGVNSPSHVKSAAAQIVASQAHEADVEPLAVLLRTIQLDWGAVQWVTSKILETEEKGDEKSPLVCQGLYGAWLDRAAKHAKLALDAGVAERQVAIAEREGEMLAGVIKAILGDLGLSKEQQREAPAVVRRHLTALSA
jgi:hypothetical protein